MTLTMTQDCFNTRNEANALKGEKVELISDRSYPVLLVSVMRGNTEHRFPVRFSGTDYEEQKKKNESNNV